MVETASLKWQLSERVLPKRCRGSTHLPGCHSQAWWDLEGLFFQAATAQKEKKKPSE